MKLAATWLTPPPLTSTRRETSTKKTFTTFGYSLVDKHPRQLQRRPRHRPQHRQVHPRLQLLQRQHRLLLLLPQLQQPPQLLHDQHPHRGVFRRREGVRLRGRGRECLTFAWNAETAKGRNGATARAMSVRRFPDSPTPGIRTVQSRYQRRRR